MRGKRKFITALFCGALAFTAFLFTPMDSICYGLLLGFLGVVVKLYNDANVKANGHDK